ncbi:hypothetical protein SpCBS45565_g06275 [Spizellomyces sp. 'palustris']|nr:hypothetical protein SpCBS45565_g06275 [Spizellomyces sp. 'palustris']
MAKVRTEGLSAETVHSSDEESSPETNGYNDEDLELEYQPPKGFVREPLTYTSAFDFDSITSDKEVWLFRVPNEVPVTKLKGLILRDPTIPTPSSFATEPTPVAHLTLPATTPQSSEEEYAIHDITTPNTYGEPGEMLELKPLLPSKRLNRYSLSKTSCTRFFSVTPVADLAPTSAALQEKGCEAKEEAYERPQHPEGLTLQSLPFGFDTAGKALELSLERYNLDARFPAKSKRGVTNESTPAATPKNKKASSKSTPSTGKKRKQEAEGQMSDSRKAPKSSEKKRKKVKSQED